MAPKSTAMNNALRISGHGDALMLLLILLKESSTTIQCLLKNMLS